MPNFSWTYFDIKINILFSLFHFIPMIYIYIYIYGFKMTYIELIPVRKHSFTTNGQEVNKC